MTLYKIKLDAYIKVIFNSNNICDHIMHVSRFVPFTPINQVLGSSKPLEPTLHLLNVSHVTRLYHQRCNNTVHKVEALCRLMPCSTGIHFSYLYLLMH